MAYPTVTEHHKRYPDTSIMASPYSCDPTGVTDIAAAIEQLKSDLSNSGTVVVPKGTFAVATNLTLPAGMLFKFEAGGSFVVAAGKTLTVQSDLEFPDSQRCFSGAGTITLGTSFSTDPQNLTLSRGTWSVTANTTIPSNVNVIMRQGATFSIATGITLTISGNIDAGRYQIFSYTGTGTVALSTSPVYPEWWGADNDGVVESSTAINNALNSGSKNIRLAQGTYAITSTITVPVGVSLTGASPHDSIISATNCNAVTMGYGDGSATYYGPQLIEGFAVLGTTCGTKYGIQSVGTASTSAKLQGARFSNLRIQNFGWGMYFRNLWFSRINDCVLYQNDVGIKYAGQNVGNYFTRNHIEYAAVVGSAGSSIGFLGDVAADYDPGGATTHDFEDVQINNNQFYAYTTQIKITRGTVVNILRNNIDNSGTTGIEITDIYNTNLIIRENWIALGLTGVYGIKINTPTVGTTGIKTISNNQINGYAGGAVNQYGIYFDSSNYNWHILNNKIKDFTTIGIRLGDVLYGPFNVKGNDLLNTSNYTPACDIYVRGASVASRVNIEDNYLSNYIFVHGTNTGLINIGKNGGICDYYVRGYTTIANGAVTGTTTFAAMYGVPRDFPATATYNVIPTLRILSANAALGHITGVATISNVTIDCTIAAGGNQKVYWEVISYTNQEV